MGALQITFIWFIARAMSTNVVDIKNVDKVALLHELWSGMKPAVFFAAHPSMIPSFDADKARDAVAGASRRTSARTRPIRACTTATPAPARSPGLWRGSAQSPTESQLSHRLHRFSSAQTGAATRSCPLPTASPWSPGRRVRYCAGTVRIGNSSTDFERGEKKKRGDDQEMQVFYLCFILL